jgi:hypothetical protein
VHRQPGLQHEKVAMFQSGTEELVNQWTTNMWLTFLVVWEKP